VKDVIRGNINKFRTFILGNISYILETVGVNFKGEFRLILCFIEVGMAV